MPVAATISKIGKAITPDTWATIDIIIVTEVSITTTIDVAVITGGDTIIEATTTVIIIRAIRGDRDNRCGLCAVAASRASYESLGYPAGRHRIGTLDGGSLLGPEDR